MRQAFTRVLALCLCLVAAPVAVHAQTAAATATQANENIVKQLVAARKADKKTVEPAAAKANAEALVASAGIPCTVSDVADYGEVKLNAGKVTGVGKAVEVACQNDLGYVITQFDKDKALASDCIMGVEVDAALACKLPANATPYKTMQPLLATAKSPCVADAVRSYGQGPTAFYYEVKCTSGQGQILIVDKPRTPTSKVALTPCVAVQANQPACKLTTPEQNMAPIRALAVKAVPTCKIVKDRYVMHLASGADYYEFACEDKSGLMIQSDATNQLLKSVGCARAAAIDGGCKLTDASASMAQAQAGFVTTLTGMGVKCDFGKFDFLPTKPDGTEAVEYQCKNAPGGVLLTKADSSMVVNCGRSLAEGYQCTLTPKDQAYASVTAQLVAKGKKSCTVNGVRPMASASFAYLEVSCSDGEPGFMMRYPRASNEPSEIFTCGDAKGISGGCALPTNKKA
jgi:hypothetical protein